MLWMSDEVLSEASYNKDKNIVLSHSIFLSKSDS